MTGTSTIYYAYRGRAFRYREREKYRLAGHYPTRILLATDGSEDAAHKGKRAPKTRVRSLLAFDGVLSVKTRGVSRADPDMVYSLLAVEFEPDQDPPGGIVRLHFAGDGEVELAVEVLDVTLLDSDYEWTTRHTPQHDRRRR